MHAVALREERTALKCGILAAVASSRDESVIMERIVLDICENLSVDNRQGNHVNKRLRFLRVSTITNKEPPHHQIYFGI